MLAGFWLDFFWRVKARQKCRIAITETTYFLEFIVYLNLLVALLNVETTINDNICNEKLFKLRIVPYHKYNPLPSPGLDYQ